MSAKVDGDRHLSDKEWWLWQLVHHVLVTWNTLVLMRWERINVPRKKNEIIWFMVPEHATHKHEIIKFLEYELERERREPEDIEGEYWPGTEVRIIVTTFRGFEPLMDRDKREGIAKEAMSQFFAAIDLKRRTEQHGKPRAHTKGKGGGDSDKGVDA